MTARDKLLSLLENLPEPMISQVVDFIEFLADKRRRESALPRILAEAPYDDEPTTPEEDLEVEEAQQAARRGDVISADDLKRKYGLV
ncbi:MAG TPA: hypothetical protein V6D00_15460 [Pantanalinema sp.]